MCFILKMINTLVLNIRGLWLRIPDFNHTLAMHFHCVSGIVQLYQNSGFVHMIFNILNATAWTDIYETFLINNRIVTCSGYEKLDYMLVPPFIADMAIIVYGWAVGSIGNIPTHFRRIAQGITFHLERLLGDSTTNMIYRVKETP